MELLVRGKRVASGKCLLMGIINATPDSFSDGGDFINPAAAVTGALDMLRDGAAIVDVGGESTRPGSERVDAGTELGRVIPVIEGIRMADGKALLSVDTYKKEVALAALEAGADIINDISGGTTDPGIMETAASYNAGFVIMHMQGTPERMQEAPSYSDKGVVYDIKTWFEGRITAAKKAGINEKGIILDPGIGFGKTLRDNYEILAGLREFREFGLPVLAGVSRKSLIGKVTGAPARERGPGTDAAVTICVLNGADILRVHDVPATAQALAVAQAYINRGKLEEK